MVQLDKVPCIQVNSANIVYCWSHLSKAIEQSHFVAIDLELSGLGDKKKLILKDIEGRFKAISEVARTRSIVSVGLSFFRYNRPFVDSSVITPSEDELNEWNYKVTNFELLTLCKEESVLEEEAEMFLVSHGFDFDAQRAVGLPYLRADQEEDPDLPSIRNLFLQIVKKKVPLILHNGLIDLIFIYHSFLANLPSKLPSFVADLELLFPKGVFDTKYIAENILNPKGSYLEYLFYQRQRNNLERKVEKKPFISINFISDETISRFVVEKSLKSNILGDKPDGLKICDDYRLHGWCKQGSSCQKSHDIDFILDDEDIYKEPSKHKKRVLAKMNSVQPFQENSAVSGNTSASTDGNREHINGQVKSGIHRSGYDAFMTGYCFATFILKLSKQKPGKSGRLNFSTSAIKKVTNRIFLTGKKEPLQIHCSLYSKPTSTVTKIMSVSRVSNDSKEKTCCDKKPLEHSNSTDFEESKSPNSISQPDCDYITNIIKGADETDQYEIPDDLREYLKSFEQCLRQENISPVK